MNQTISAIEYSGVKAMDGSYQAFIARTLEYLLVGSDRRDATRSTKRGDSPPRASSLHPQVESTLGSTTRTQPDSKSAAAGGMTDGARSLVNAARAQLAPAIGTAVLLFGVAAVVLAPGFAREELSARLQIEAPVPAATAIAVAQDR